MHPGPACRTLACGLKLGPSNATHPVCLRVLLLCVCLSLCMCPGSRLEVSAQRTLTKPPAIAKKGPAPVDADEEEDSEGAAKPAKGKTFATGRKTDDNAGATVAGVVVGSVVISLPFYWANVKRFVGKYTDIFKATTGLSDGDESRAGRQNEDM